MYSVIRAIRKRRRDREKIKAVRVYCEKITRIQRPNVAPGGASFNAWAARQDMAALILAILRD